MESHLMERISEEIKHKRGAALALITKCEGASPGKEGFMLGVFEDGSVIGTLGGGAIEFSAIIKAKECLKAGKGGNFTYDLGEDGNLGMLCGGTSEVYIRVFKAPEKILISGGGHIALELYKLCEYLEFKTVIFEDREEYGNTLRFPNSEIILGDYKENLSKYIIDEHTYVVIVTRGHKCDEGSLEAVVNSNAAYIGMIGSYNKVKTITDNLMTKGIKEEAINRVHAPIGIDLGGSTPSEIAVSIISEILLVKNKGTLTHLKQL
jgi:xanthine dehydrogenase accessory factor